MSLDNINMDSSVNLEKAFEDYRKTPEYKEELEAREKTLKVLWIFDEFATALAIDSVETGIKVSELLEVEDQILEENSRLKPELLDSRIESIIDSTRQSTNKRMYGWTWRKAA